MATEEQASLRVRGGSNNGITIPLSGEPVILGRGHDNDLEVDDETVSRRHALIMGTPDGFVLRDLGSANGTYVNLGRLSLSERRLVRGDRIRLARSQVTFLFRQPDASTVEMRLGSPPDDADVDEERQVHQGPSEEAPAPPLGDEGRSPGAPGVQRGDDSHHRGDRRPGVARGARGDRGGRPRAEGPPGPPASPLHPVRRRGVRVHAGAGLSGGLRHAGCLRAGTRVAQRRHWRCSHV